MHGLYVTIVCYVLLAFMVWIVVLERDRLMAFMDLFGSKRDRLITIKTASRRGSRETEKVRREEEEEERVRPSEKIEEEQRGDPSQPHPRAPTLAIVRERSRFESENGTLETPSPLD
ncbi:hypothetical protein Tco_0879032 [Tanacetum coccineum]